MGSLDWAHRDPPEVTPVGTGCPDAGGLIREALPTAEGQAIACGRPGRVQSIQLDRQEVPRATVGSHDEDGRVAIGPVLSSLRTTDVAIRVESADHASPPPEKEPAQPWRGMTGIGARELDVPVPAGVHDVDE